MRMELITIRKTPMATKINTNPAEQSSSVSAAKLDAASKRIGGTTLKMHSMIPMVSRSACVLL